MKSLDEEREMKQEKEKFVEPICVRCGRSALDSGVPHLCSSCTKEMTRLAKKLSTYSVQIHQWFMLGWSVERILRNIRKDGLKTLVAIDEIEKEREEND